MNTFNATGKELLDNVKENVHAEQIYSNRTMDAETLDDFRDIRAYCYIDELQKCIMLAVYLQ